jgi:hypothetical protein
MSIFNKYLLADGKVGGGFASVEGTGPAFVLHRCVFVQGTRSKLGAHSSRHLLDGEAAWRETGEDRDQNV